MTRLACLLALAVLAATGCHEPKSFVVHRPTDARVDAKVTALWAHEVRGVARDGDWVLTRSYYAIGDAIAAVTPGEDLSHASIYDAKRDTVVEAVGSGVREIPLAELLQRNHYVIVVRPTGMTAAEQARALDRARTKVGVPFDNGGLFGLGDDAKFYCSELVWWASETAARTGETERIITPAELMKYGQVIYWSGQRDDHQVMAVAAGR